MIYNNFPFLILPFLNFAFFKFCLFYFGRICIVTPTSPNFISIMKKISNFSYGDLLSGKKKKLSEKRHGKFSTDCYRKINRKEQRSQGL